MRKKVRHIPTIAEYVRKRRRDQEVSCDVQNCFECAHYRAELKVCICGDNVRSLDSLYSCPISQKALVGIE